MSTDPFSFLEINPKQAADYLWSLPEDTRTSVMRCARKWLDNVDAEDAARYTREYDYKARIRPIAGERFEIREVRPGYDWSYSIGEYFKTKEEALKWCEKYGMEVEDG